MTHKRLHLGQMIEQFDPAKHGGEFPATGDSAPRPATGIASRKVFGLIERAAGGSYQGRIIGFEHVTFTDSSVEVVKERLITHAAQLISSGTLSLESDFESVVPIGELEVVSLRDS
jgi:hypothetical protein